jgi:hypothetical protein
MSNLSPQEHYELIRILLESHLENVTICKHNSTNKYVDILLLKLGVKCWECHSETQVATTFLDSRVDHPS